MELGIERRPVNPSIQPCTDTWRIEPVYTDSRTLLNNWRETRAQTQHERQVEHQKYLLPTRSCDLPRIGACNRVLPPLPSLCYQNDNQSKNGHFADAMLLDARTRPYSRYFNCHLNQDDQSKCEPGTQCNPPITSKLATWHHVNKTNYTPEEVTTPTSDNISDATPSVYRFRMKGLTEELPPFPYPKQWIYGTPRNHGLLASKKADWNRQNSCSGSAPVWGHEAQRNTVYKLSYKKPPIKAANTLKFPPKLVVPGFTESFSLYRGEMNGLIKRYQTTSQLEKSFNDRANHLHWKTYSGIPER